MSALLGYDGTVPNTARRWYAPWRPRLDKRKWRCEHCGMVYDPYGAEGMSHEMRWCVMPTLPPVPDDEITQPDDIVYAEPMVIDVEPLPTPAPAPATADLVVVLASTVEAVKAALAIYDQVDSAHALGEAVRALLITGATVSHQDVSIEGRIINGYGYTREADFLNSPGAAQDWAEHCNSDETYYVSLRPVRAEQRTVFRTPFYPVHLSTIPPVPVPLRADLAATMQADPDRYDAHYPGFRANFVATLATLRERGPWCDLCTADIAQPVGATGGWYHVTDEYLSDHAAHDAVATQWEAMNG